METKKLAQDTNGKVAFLSHSHKDSELAEKLETYLRECGWDIYIDWKDTSLPGTPSHETAVKIKEKIVEAEVFLYLATKNSSESKWCPWEIGFADPHKTWENLIIIPTEDACGEIYGQEYLDLYNFVQMSPTAAQLGIREAKCLYQSPLIYKSKQSAFGGPSWFGITGLNRTTSMR